LEVNTAGFWICFLGSKFKRREQSAGTVRADVEVRLPTGVILFLKLPHHRFKNIEFFGVIPNL